jgi:DNA-binding NarL/FixJ family response regulator
MIRVLLADDQTLVREGFRMILEAQPDIEVVGEAGDGLHALELARETNPDLVLMDIRMPGMDGLDATRTLVASGAPTRVVILTTFDLDEYVYEAFKAGASGFLLKDLPRSQLIAAVRTAADGDALLSPSITRRLIEEFVRNPPQPHGIPEALRELSERELDVLRLLARGLSNAEIADRLVVSAATVKTHVAHILQKLDLRDRVQAVVLAYDTGLVRRGAKEGEPA